jgi:hypothetical protein
MESNKNTQMDGLLNYFVISPECRHWPGTLANKQQLWGLESHDTRKGKMLLC